MNKLNREVIKDFLMEFEVKHDYFECHELLELAWKEEFKVVTKDNGYVVLLQIAVAHHHFERQNYVGAGQMLVNCRRNYRQLAHGQISEFWDLEFIESYLKHFDFVLSYKKFMHLSLLNGLKDPTLFDVSLVK